MSKDNTIRFGQEMTYVFKDVAIDEKIGFPISFNGEKVGGILYEKITVLNHEVSRENGFTYVLLKGIEIEKDFRRRGIAKQIVEIIRKDCDALVGAITEKEAITFWAKVGAKLFVVPEKYLSFFDGCPDITTGSPLTFFIAHEQDVIDFMEKRILRNLEKYHHTS